MKSVEILLMARAFGSGAKMLFCGKFSECSLNSGTSGRVGVLLLGRMGSFGVHKIEQRVQEVITAALPCRRHGRTRSRDG